MPTTLLIVLCEAVKFNFMLWCLYDVLSYGNGFLIPVDIIIVMHFIVIIQNFSIVITHFRFSDIFAAKHQENHWKQDVEYWDLKRRSL